MTYEIREQLALAFLASLDPHSLDAIITDPPYGIGFMARKWDTFKPEVAAKFRERTVHDRSDSDNPNLRGRTRWAAGAAVEYDYRQNAVFGDWCREWATAARRVLKPGAFLVVCAGDRTFHRVAVGIEDAGFEIRPCVAWLYGQGFPKSMPLGEGKGTALKPAFEPIIVARAPLDGTTKATHEKWGTAAINVDDGRIEGEEGDGHWSADDGSDATSRPGYEGGFTKGGTRRRLIRAREETAQGTTYGERPYGSTADGTTDVGRWPSNVVLDEAVAAELDAEVGDRRAGGAVRGDEPSPVFSDRVYGDLDTRQPWVPYLDGGGPSRFFYVAKASRGERELGCEHLPRKSAGEATGGRKEGSAGLNSPRTGAGRTKGARNFHPTVKPVTLMRRLVRLFVPHGGTVADPFLGSGTTGVAAVLEQRHFIGCEREPEYLPIARARLAHAASTPRLPGVDI